MMYLMKRLRITILLSLVVAMSSCFREPKGFPNKVVFGPEGGERTLTGFNYSYLDIATMKGIVLSYSGYDGNRNDSLVVAEFDWLKVSGKNRGNTITVSVKPNPTGKTRQFWVGITTYDNRTNSFKVIQTANIP